MARSDSERAMMEERWETLSEMMQDREAFIFSEHGCLTDSELHTALKVTHMPADKHNDRALCLRDQDLSRHVLVKENKTVGKTEEKKLPKYKKAPKIFAAVEEV